ncbi:MAG: potassium transporter [Spirochaetia bacterium]|nr:potassium transporter [Spirochaetia bacterium]
MIKFKRQSTSERIVLFSYFLVLIGLGTFLLYLPAAWNGPARLRFVDSFFTAVSAVCVTGLVTVDTALYSLFGKIIILLLIQFGGLGILTFTTMFFVSVKNRKVSLRNLQTVRNYYLDSIEFQAHNILRNILIMTAVLELTGSLLLWFRFRTTVPEASFFTALFHSVSAFCNAGFSLFPDSLEGYSSDPYLLIVIMLLVISGGLGFLIFNDIILVGRKKKKRYALHTRIVLISTAILILSGTIGFLLMENNGTLKEMTGFSKLINALFQSVTPRTAGFNTVSQGALKNSSKVLTMIFMFIGGSPASIAGGIKTTTFAIVFLTLLKEIDWQGRIRIRDRVLPQKTVTKAILFMGKAVIFLAVSVFLLTLTETNGAGNNGSEFMPIVFESFSAFGTVGLSTGITSSLSTVGKFVIICTMFAGRVGLISLSIPLLKEHNEEIEYPEEEVLIG